MQRALHGLERMHWLIGRARAHVLLVEARLAKAPGEEAMRAALDALQTRHPALQVRVEERKDGPWLVPGGGRVPLRTAAFVDAERVRAEAERELNLALPEEGPLLRATLLEGPKAATVLLAAHPLACDALGMVALAKDLAGFLAAPDAPLSTLPEPVRLADALPRALGGKGGREGLLQRLRSGSPLALPREEAAPVGERTTRLLLRDLGAPDTAALAKRAGAQGVSVQAALEAAMLLSAARELRLRKPAALACHAPLDLRGPLRVGDSVGCFALGLPLVHRVHMAQPFWELAREADARLREVQEARRALAIADSLEASVPQAGAKAAGFAARADRAWRAAGSVGDAGTIAPPPGAAGKLLVGLRGASSVPIGACVVAAATPYGGALALSFTYPEPLVSAERAARIADGMLALLRREATA